MEACITDTAKMFDEQEELPSRALRPMSRNNTFSRLRLKNWKNFSTVNVPLQSRVFLVGPNASGKSNLLDVFRFLRDLAATGGGFQEAVSRRGGVKAIRSLAARRYPDVSIHVDIRSGEAQSWEYEAAFNQDSKGNLS
jgi:predicted ATPase